MHPFKTTVFLLILVSALITGTRIFSYCAEPAQNQLYPALVEDISDSKYFDAVHSALKSAKSSIYVSLFDISLSEQSKESLQYILLQDLIDAHKRRIKVIVRLNREYDRNSVPQRNESACFLLVREGIDCKLTASGSFLHDKLIVIDEEIVVDGSTNWTSPALRTNRESTSLIRSKEYAEEKIARIRNLEISEEEIVDPLQIETVPIQNKFLRDPGLGAHIVHTRSGQELDTYLFFLRQFHETGKAGFELDYEKLAVYLGLNYSNRDVTRGTINRVLKYLKNRYKLIDCKLVVGKPAQITLLDYDDKSKEYKKSSQYTSYHKRVHHSK